MGAQLIIDLMVGDVSQIDVDPTDQFDLIVPRPRDQVDVEERIFFEEVSGVIVDQEVLFESERLLEDYLVVYG